MNKEPETKELLLEYQRRIEERLANAQREMKGYQDAFYKQIKILDSWKDIAQKLAYHVQCNDSWCGIRNSKCDACKVLETFKQLDAPAEPSNAES
jgi:hypothetical protein